MPTSKTLVGVLELNCGRLMEDRYGLLRSRVNFFMESVITIKHTFLRHHMTLGINKE